MRWPSRTSNLVTEFDPWTFMVKQKDTQSSLTSTHRPWQAQTPPLTKWINYKFNAVPFVKQPLCTFAGTEKKQITTVYRWLPGNLGHQVKVSTSENNLERKIQRWALMQLEMGCGEFLKEPLKRVWVVTVSAQNCTEQTLPVPYPTPPVWSRGSWPRDREPCLWCLPLPESCLILHSLVTYLHSHLCKSCWMLPCNRDHKKRERVPIFFGD